MFALDFDFINYESDDKSKGIIHYKNGMRYVGNLKSGKPFGKGIIFNKNGNKIFEGHWENEGPKGQCKFYKNNGDLNCECTNEEISGKIKLYDLNGNIVCVKIG